MPPKVVVLIEITIRPIPNTELTLRGQEEKGATEDEMLGWYH